MRRSGRRGRRSDLRSKVASTAATRPRLRHRRSLPVTPLQMLPSSRELSSQDARRLGPPVLVSLVSRAWCGVGAVCVRAVWVGV